MANVVLYIFYYNKIKLKKSLKDQERVNLNSDMQYGITQQGNNIKKDSAFFREDFKLFCSYMYFSCGLTL